MGTDRSSAASSSPSAFAGGAAIALCLIPGLPKLPFLSSARPS